MSEQVQSYLLGEEKILPSATPGEWRETAHELTTTHLSQLQETLPRLLLILPESEAEAVLDGLSESGQEGIAPILNALDSEIVPKPLRKAARRALHLLSTKGIQVKTTSLPTPHSPSTTWQAWFSTPDGNGDQFWLLEKRAFRHDLFLTITHENLLHDLDYFDHMTVAERDDILQRFRKEEGETQAGFVLEIDPNHARWRVLHSAERARKLGKKLPHELPYVKKELSAPPDSEKHPVWLFFNSFELRNDPELRDPELAKALMEPQYRLRFLFFGFGRAEYVERYNQAVGGKLALPPSIREQRTNELLQEMIQTHLNEAWLEDWQWRLQDYAYAWYRQGWFEQARLALYWSLNMDNLDPRQNPFLHFFLTSNLDIFILIRERQGLDQEA
jgi:hypothetical protein